MENQERKQATNEQEKKQASTTTDQAMDVLDQVHADFTFAMALQEQERANANVNQEDEEEEEEEELSDDDSAYELNYENDYEYFESQEFEPEMEFLEGQDSNSEGDDDNMDIDEDDIDPDELSYEELVALGEALGEERQGLSLNQISKCLVSSSYESKDNKRIDRCVVCQVEYEEGEPIAMLGCQHPYHKECITKWLQIKKICPICNDEVSCPKNINEIR